MILLVDVGNSRIKFIQQDAERLSGYQAHVYDKSDLDHDLTQLWCDFPVPDQIWIANVAGDEVANQIVRWVGQHWNRIPRFARVEKQSFGVTNAYSDIARLGIDRWLAIIAAWQKYRSACCIVSCGTAITIDALDDHGQHLGGLIIPGIPMMQIALSSATTAIPKITGFKTPSALDLANDTEQAVVTGCVLAAVSLIEHVLDSLQEKYKGTVKCLITGGDSGKIMNYLHGEFIHSPLLVLEGLALMAEKQS